MFERLKKAAFEKIQTLKLISATIQTRFNEHRAKLPADQPQVQSIMDLVGQTNSTINRIQSNLNSLQQTADEATLDQQIKDHLAELTTQANILIKAKDDLEGIYARIPIIEPIEPIQADAQPPHASPSTGETADLNVYPPINAKAASQVVLGDLHGNTLKLVYFLIREGVITLDEENYNHLKDIYLRWHESNTLTKEVLQADLDKFNQIVANINLKNPREVCLIGDILADRGANDLLTLKVLQRLNEIKVPTEIINSNHDLIFQKMHELGIDQDLAEVNLQGNSILNLLELYKKDLKDNGNDVNKEYINSIFNSTYKPMLRAVSYNLSEDGNTITLLSHAPIDIEVVENMAIKLKEIAEKKGLSFDLHFDRSTPTKAAESIDRLNKAFNEYLQKDGNKIADLYPEDIKQYTTPETFQPLKKTSPFVYAAWNRDVEDLNRKPDIMGGSFRVNYGHGHDEVVIIGENNVFNVDNKLGKYNYRDKDPKYPLRKYNLSGKYQVLRMNGKHHFTPVLNVTPTPPMDIQKLKESIQTEIEKFLDNSKNTFPKLQQYQDTLKLLLDMSEKTTSLNTPQDIKDLENKLVEYQKAIFQFTTFDKEGEVNNTHDIDRVNAITDEIAGRPRSAAKEKLNHFINQFHQLIIESDKLATSVLETEVTMAIADSLPPQIKTPLIDKYNSLINKITDVQKIPAANFDSISDKSNKLKEVQAEITSLDKEVRKAEVDFRQQSRIDELDNIINLPETPANKAERENAHREQCEIYTAQYNEEKATAQKHKETHTKAMEYYGKQTPLINKELEDLNLLSNQSSDPTLQKLYAHQIGQLTIAKDNNDEKNRIHTELNAIDLNQAIEDLYQARIKPLSSNDRTANIEAAYHRWLDSTSKVHELEAELKQVDTKHKISPYENSETHISLNTAEATSTTTVDHAIDAITNLDQAYSAANTAVKRDLLSELDNPPHNNLPVNEKIEKITNNLNALNIAKPALVALRTQHQAFVTAAESHIELLKKHKAVYDQLKKSAQAIIDKADSLEEAKSRNNIALSDKTYAENELTRLTNELRNLEALNQAAKDAIVEANATENTYNNLERDLRAKQTALTTPPPAPPPPPPRTSSVDQLAAAITHAKEMDEAFKKIMSEPVRILPNNTALSTLDLPSELEDKVNHLRDLKRNGANPAVINELDLSLDLLRGRWGQAKIAAHSAVKAHTEVMRLAQEKFNQADADVVKTGNDLLAARAVQPPDKDTIETLEKKLAEEETKKRNAYDDQQRLKTAAEAADEILANVTEKDHAIQEAAVERFLDTNPDEVKIFESMRKHISERYIKVILTYDNTAANATYSVDDRNNLMRMNEQLKASNNSIAQIKEDLLKFARTAREKINSAATSAKEKEKLRVELEHAENCIRRIYNIEANLITIKAGPIKNYSYFGSGIAEIKHTAKDAEDLLNAHLTTAIPNGNADPSQTIPGLGLESQDNKKKVAPNPLSTGEFVSRYYPANIEEGQPIIRGGVVQTNTARTFTTTIKYNPEDVNRRALTDNPGDVPHALWLKQAQKHLHSHLCAQNAATGPIYLKGIDTVPEALIKALIIVAVKEGKTIYANANTESPKNMRWIEQLKEEVTKDKLREAQKFMLDESPSNTKDPLGRLSQKGIAESIPRISPHKLGG